jgi:hypothetical protein
VTYLLHRLRGRCQCPDELRAKITVLLEEI